MLLIVHMCVILIINIDIHQRFDYLYTPFKQQKIPCILLISLWQYPLSLQDTHFQGKPLYML